MQKTYPEFKPIELSDGSDIKPVLYGLCHGISEYTFANLYLFRNTYNYEFSFLSPNKLIIRGEKKGERFILFPFGLPEDDCELFSLLETYDYAKGVPEHSAEKNRIRLNRKDYCAFEDRDNFDYLYLKKDLAYLEGKKYHKKRNLVNAFINNYEYEERPLKENNLKDAFAVLDIWMGGRKEDGDFVAAKEALELRDELGLWGCVYYVDGKPAAYTLGEELAKGKMFAVHFEKADSRYKGIYQFINKAFATFLPHKYVHINREQDLGDPGLRQAKLTYRPSGFVKKYQIRKMACDDSD